MILKKNLNIATILPYKENFTFGKASAASLWVSEFFKNSKYKKNNVIYGHTKSKDYLSKNYKNINLENLKIKKGQDQLTVYKFGKKHLAEHFFCKNCGIYTHHRSYTNPKNYEYNVGCIDNLNSFEYKNIPVFDGDKI